MLQTDNSIRGKVMRELIARVASDNLIGRKFKSGELRKKMTEPEWRVPEFYNLRVIEEKIAVWNYWSVRSKTSVLCCCSCTEADISVVCVMHTAVLRGYTVNLAGG